MGTLETVYRTKMQSCPKAEDIWRVPNSEQHMSHTSRTYMHRSCMCKCGRCVAVVEPSVRVKPSGSAYHHLSAKLCVISMRVGVSESDIKGKPVRVATICEYLSQF